GQGGPPSSSALASLTQLDAQSTQVQPASSQFPGGVFATALGQQPGVAQTQAGFGLAVGPMVFGVPMSAPAPFLVASTLAAGRGHGKQQKRKGKGAPGLRVPSFLGQNQYTDNN